ncbi:ThiF family adenylyltransferase [Alicyclobacillus cycloheptanicus]|uniref:Adenylyltransferase/sulfurtransferase n=1 Tax=Alicyclobacillus cycloheptanicus TaxID=1457 RepID=A0ABT9XK55_9BACL|nr:ThiF family adenylyltransferase [Alicyclobacillus cycloheptanicus]MDQ0190689.1 adenylyltransferase/sulfurtransferase [Alicyclobacillus cycloheptanicus]WDM00296.1 ThiF family adenylyltransferase [Alicyclobacillus cycloheptanicus]
MPHPDALTDRYSRQILFRPIGPDGQQRLRQSRIAIVGLGALGTVLATQMVRAGVGFVRLIDRDIVEPSNLQRQSLYDEADALAGRAKAEAAADKLRQANHDVDIDIAMEDVTWRNAERLLSDVDAILDGTDNLQVRHLINDVAVKHDIPWAYGGAVSSYGTTAFLQPGQTPCLVCLFGSEPGGGHDTCDTVGVIAPVVSIIASLQTAETLKYLSGNINALSQSMTHVDVWRNEFVSMQLGEPQADCPCCGQREFRALRARSDGMTVSLCGRQTIQVRPETPLQVPLDRMAQRLASLGTVTHSSSLLRCDFGAFQITLFADGRALLHGIEDAAQARSLYARYIGM